jgi:hypothetical protein
MPDELSADDKALIERALKNIRTPNRRIVPAQKVKLFLQMVGDELKRTGHLKKDYVDQLVNQLKSGAL